MLRLSTATGVFSPSSARSQAGLMDRGKMGVPAPVQVNL